MSFAVADVIGKGIPAALAMSMIKFGMDSYGHSQLPSDGLKRLNRVVEKTSTKNMFVTMFYGLYEEMNHLYIVVLQGMSLVIFIELKQNNLKRLTFVGVCLE